jgi:ferredoxin-nitrate reductase
VSKQPAFKGGAVRVVRLSAGTGPAPAPDTTASAPATREV